MHRAGPLAPPAIAVGPVLKRAQGLPWTVAASLAERVASCPDGVLWTYDPVGNHRSRTHSQAWQRSGAIAAALQQLGARAGQPVVLLIRDVVDFVPAFWACLRGGFVAVPLNGVAEQALQTDGHTPLRDMLERLNYPILLFDEHFHRLGDTPGLAAAVALADVEADAESCRDAAPADPACLVPTSGSTGRQRLVALGPDAILHRFFAGSAAMTKPLTALSAFPLDSITGLRAAYLCYGGWVQLSPAVLFGRPLSLLDAIERFRVGRVSMTSSMAARVLTAGDDSGCRADLSSLRQFDLGAEPVVPEVARRLERLLAEHGAPAGIIRAGYGTTETGPLVLGDDPVASASGDDGLAPLGGCAPGVSIRIVGDHDEILAEGAVGQVQALCSQTIFAGYWGEPEASHDGFTADRWWKTGDLGRLRDGNLTLHGRSKEVLIVRGRKHSLAEIDAHLEEEVGPGIRTFSCAVHWPNEPTERLAVVFATAPGALDRGTDVAGRIRRAVARRFGLDAQPVIAASLERIPFTATGKLRRFELAEGVRSATLGADARSWSRDTIPETVERANEPALWRIWREALGIEGELDPEASFFDLGGDSLCSVRLLTEVELRFGRSVPLADFFAAPTLARLRQLVDDTGSPPTAGAAPIDAIPWPLPPELHHRLNSYFATWDGERPTRDRLVAGLNTAGARPPLFWVFQGAVEFRRLAAHLGPEQPLYALRSGHLIISRTDEDAIQTLALRYASEIIEARPAGPLFLGGNCQGGIIALAAAQHLLRRGRHVPLLVLMEWGFPLQPYPGPVLLLYGHDSVQANPHKRHRHPQLAWRRVFADYAVAEIRGAHGTFFDEGNVETLAATLGRHLREAASRVPRLLPMLARRAELAANDLPVRMRMGERRWVDVRVRNSSPVAWDAWERSGLALGNYWMDPAGAIVERVDGRAALPALGPGGEVRVRLSVTAPAVAGTLLLIIDVVEEGNTWFDPERASALRSTVTIA